MKRRSAFRRIIPPLSLTGILMLTAWTPNVHAQIERTLHFIPDKVDFGVVREEDGKLTRTVKAVNISADTTFIISARTSCGCSAAEYSDSILAPGDTTEVTLSYDPLNRPGKFLKTAKFFTGQERTGNSIKLSGTVIPSRKNLDMSYPVETAPLRLSTGILNLGDISRSEARPLFIGIYNDSGNPVVLAAETDSGPLESALMPDTIDAYGVGTLSLMLKGRYIPENEKEINYRTYIINAESGDTIASIPVGGFVKTN